MSNGLVVLKTAALAALCSFFWFAQTAFAQERGAIPWTPGVTFTWTAVNEDIKPLLRRVIEADGNLRPIIKTDIKGQVTVQFQNVPPEAAFNQLIEENNLGYTYDRDQKTVTVSVRGRVTRQDTKRDFITPQAVSFDAIRRALRAFGLGLDGVTFDEPSNTISVVGLVDRVDNVRKLIDQLDASAVQRQKLLDERQKSLDEQREKAQTLTLKEQEAEAARIKAEAERKKAEAEQVHAEFQRKIYDRLLDFKTKVIRLRFATVGTTEKKFQNKTFTVPGIEETLQKILGIPVTGAPGSRTATPAQNLINQLGTYLPSSKVGAPRPPGATSAVISSYQSRPSALASALKPVISVDPRTNSVIVRGTDEAIAEVEKIIRELDKPLQMIEIEVVIVKADANVSEELGIRYRGEGQKLTPDRSAAIDTGVTGDTKAEEATSGLDAITLLPTVTGGRVVSSFIIKGSEAFLQAEIVALAQKNRLQVVSSPRVVTLDNVTARVTQAKNLFFETQASGNSGQVLQEVETGLELSILPSIIPSDVAGERNLIRLELTARKSDPQAAATGGSVDVESAEVQTQVLIPDGATFVMAGLFDDTRTENESGIPFLKDIPILGGLFRTNTSSDALVETIFFLTPRVVDQATLSKDIAARVGTRDYMQRQRAFLSRVSRGIETDTQRTFPNALRVLEEDE